MMRSFQGISFHLLVVIVILKGQRAGIYAKRSVKIGHLSSDDVKDDTDPIEIRNNILGNGINSNRTTHYLKMNPSLNYSKSSSSISDVDKTTSLPQSHPTSIPELSKSDDVLIHSRTKIMSTKRITTNPLTDLSLYMYDSMPQKNRLASVYSIRRTKTKSDTTIEKNDNPYPRRVILEGQTHQTKHLLTMNNINMDSIKIPISLFHIRNKQQQQKNQNMVEQQQRILSTTKILNKRNAITNDINEGYRGSKVPSEKQQHKRHAFNDTTNGFGNGTDEQGITRNDLPFSSYSNMPSDQSPPNFRPLSIEVYKRLRDAVMLDWYISLSDKDQMSTCNVGYVKSDYFSRRSKTQKDITATQAERRKKGLMEQLLNTVAVHKSTSPHHPNPEESNITLINSYIPTTRTFFIAPLESNYTYLFQMACVDTQGRLHMSKQLSITKATSNAPSYHEYKKTDLLRTSKVMSRSNEKQRVPLSWFSKHQSNPVSRSQSSFKTSSNEMSARPASPVASISLPAISSSAVEAAVVGRENTMHVIERISWRNRVSPHFVLGVSCSIVGLIIIIVTLGLAFRRYSKYRSSQTRLWEQQVVREQSSSNSGSTVPHNHDIVSAIDLDEDSSYCQIHSYENSRTPNNILRSFPPPYTETCPLNSMNLQERNYSSENQRINDGILYELDSQYLHQILPSSNPPSNTNNSSSNYVYRNYANNGRK